MTDSRRPTIIEVYQRHAEAWAELRSDELVESSWLDRFSAMLPAGRAVLNIGCSSGLRIGRELIRRGFDLDGVDDTPTMLSLFNRNLPNTPAHLMDMGQLALARRFSGLLAWTASFIFRPPISARCSRASKPMLRRAPR